MTDKQLSERVRSRQAIACAIAALLALAAWTACTAPISTMRSPYHLRMVEVENTSEGEWLILVAPAGDQALSGATTTFTGVLQPGRTKRLFLYHGFEYVFRIVEGKGTEIDEIARAELLVDHDMGLLFAGDSLVPEATLAVELGEPTFADSLQALDPFGLRRGEAVRPDTARGNRPSPIDDRARPGRGRGGGRQP